MSVDDELGGGWVGYLITSDKPADEALLDEHRARSWAYAQTIHWIAGRDGVGADAFNRLRQENALVNELQGRVHARGVKLQAAGHAPANEAAFKAWRAAWVPWASRLQSYNEPMLRPSSVS